MDQDLKDFLAGTVGVVEATDFEKHTLWAAHAADAECDPTNPARLTWEQNNAGLLWTIGQLGRRPVNLSLFSAVISGKKILFWGCVSQVCDHKMIDKWLAKNMPRTAFRADGHLNEVTAANFTNVLRANTQSASEEAVETLAEKLYEESRRRVKGRPEWALLDPDDAYDMGMRETALSKARDQLGV